MEEEEEEEGWGERGLGGRGWVVWGALCLLSR